MKKISLKDVKNGLKRDEMRSIQGGGCLRSGGSCNGDSTCSTGCRNGLICDSCCIC